MWWWCTGRSTGAPTGRCGPRRRRPRRGRSRRGCRGCGPRRRRVGPGFRACPPSVEAVRAAVDEDVAAVLLEPVLGESGVHPLPDEVLRAARAACDAVGAALVFDEVQTGMGRTGTLWAYERTGVEP